MDIGRHCAGACQSAHACLLTSGGEIKVLTGLKDTAERGGLILYSCEGETAIGLNVILSINASDLV